jgi:hypothetical protein
MVTGIYAEAPACDAAKCPKPNLLIKSQAEKNLRIKIS